MTTKNAQHRPHCVDISPGAFNSSGHKPASVTHSAAGRPSRKILKTAPRKAPASTSNPAIRGAVRVNSAARASQEPANHAPKLRIALAAVVAGIVWTSVQTETKTPPEKQVDIEPPEVVRAIMPTPNFFFDDAVDALTAHFSNKNENELNANDDPERLPGSKLTIAKLTEDMPIPAPLSTLKPQTDSAFTSKVAFDPQPSLQSAPAKPQISTTLPTIDHPSLHAQRAKADLPEGASEIVVAVAPGNTLSGILNKHGIRIEQLSKLLSDDMIKQNLTNLTVGQKLKIVQTQEGLFHSLTTRVGDSQRINIHRLGDDYTVTSVDLPVEKERVVTSGTIEQSLYLAAEEANLKQSTIMELADIFQWELDFAKDIRKGDQFSLVYDRLYRDGSYIGDGDILAAEFIRGGRTHRAIRFTTDDGVTGYYSPDGKSKRRTFMRHPVDVVRITSKFNPNRMHPVLHQLRAHRGVDYGSPTGSPIYATADGKVKFSGVNGAYGNTVILQHGQKFSTLYAHMSKIASKSVKGTRVKQGDVIGYVGKTGRVTGPHLHYEFRVNNKQIDPLAVELPAAQPIDKKYLAELKALSDEMTLQMRSVLTTGVNEQVASITDIISPRTTPQLD